MKCVRVASPSDRDLLISEMVRPGAMAQMIDDNYANYVVQTALDYAEGEQRAQLIREIMPLLSTVKSRSWYKRIVTKIGLGVNNHGGHYDSRHSTAGRSFGDDTLHRINSEPRGLASLGYGQAHGTERLGEPPGFMYAPIGSHSSERNGYRMQHQPPSQATQQYGNFYPYGPRAPVHHAEYRTNSDY